MCGRFTDKLTWEELVRLYRLTADQPARSTQARYNVCPTDPIDTVVDHDGKRELVTMRWSLVPRWWSKTLKDVKMATFNARAETVETKPFFRDAFKRTRCLIPVSGYYEWQDTPGGKQPWYFTARDGSPALTIAGLWDEWRDRASGQALKSCTMIITEPNAFVVEAHDRMPALLAGLTPATVAACFRVSIWRCLNRLQEECRGPLETRIDRNPATLVTPTTQCSAPILASGGADEYDNREPSRVPLTLSGKASAELRRTTLRRAPLCGATLTATQLRPGDNDD